MSSERKNNRLPPPAFPPGARGKAHRNSTPARKPSSSTDRGDDAYISPDDPLPPRSDKLAKAFISPDDPLPPRADEAQREKIVTTFVSAEDLDPLPTLGAVDEEHDEGVVTGMGFDAHMEPEELVTGGDPYVMEVVDAVGKLADALRRKGQAGLRATPGMSRFEATLRSYCVGYLAGRRAEEEADRAEVGRRSQPKSEPPEL